MIINTVLISGLVLLVLSLLRFLRRVWWDPIQIKKMMEAQGIRGPPYKFLHGSAKEAAATVRESMSRPMELSNNITPRVQPYLHAWIKEYGKKFFKVYYLHLCKFMEHVFQGTQHIRAATL